MTKFDLTKTRVLEALFAVPREGRDEQWRQRFLAAAPDATLAAFDPQVERGPDGFPYFQLAMPDTGPVTAFCISHVLDFCLDNGLGIAVFGNVRRADPPEWVFTYGNLLSYSVHGNFDCDPAEPASPGGPRSITTTETHEMLIAGPSETYLPACARKAIGSFLGDAFGHPDPRVALVFDPKLEPPRYLMVNLTLEHYGGDREKLRAALQYLSWFLPGNYSLMSMPAGWTADNFVPLA